jgi:nitrite reductase/ring-hydroxylating ferredoxin subunit
MNGQIECLKYAYENKCPWNKWTSYYASKNGHLECLKYAIENGCPWDKNECLKLAIKNNKNSIINFIENLKNEKN